MRFIKFSHFCLLLIVAVNVKGQNRDYQYTKMFWTETIVAGKIKSKFGYQLDYQYRRSAEPNLQTGGDHNNIFTKPFQQVVRPWIHYQANEKIRLSLSPIGWWGTWSGSHNNLQFVPEFRICPQVTLNQFFGRVTISHRYRYEFRFFGDKKTAESGWDATQGYNHFTDDMHTKGRIRYFIRAITLLNNTKLDVGTFYLNIYNEIFLNTGKSVANTNLLDQNRLFCGAGYRFNTLFRLEAGYLSQTAFRFNNVTKDNIEQNNVLQLFLIFDDFNQIFKKKSQEGETK